MALSTSKSNQYTENTPRIFSRAKRLHLESQSPNISYQRSPTTTKIDGSMDSQEAMIRERGKFNSAFYLPLLKKCIDDCSLPEARIIHSHIIRTGTHTDIYLMTFLVNVYVKCGNMEDARRIFDELPRRNVYSWTALMMGYVKNSKPVVAVQVFQEMLETGSYPTNYTLGTFISACSSMSSIKLGKQIHAFSIKYQLESDPSVGNALCSFYSQCASLECAVKAFRRIDEKDVISWTAVISAAGDNAEAEMGLKLFTEMLYDKVEPNEYTMTTILSLCCAMQNLDLGSQIHSLIIKLGYELNLRIKNSVMYLYLKCGLINDAHKLFDGMESSSRVTWNAMIAGHAQMMNFAEDNVMARRNGTGALNIYMRMNRIGLKPDLFTLSSILTVCSSLVAVEKGEQVHAQTIKSGFLSDVIVGTALVNMYNKCGSIERASKAFVEMPTRTMISWTSMITAFSQHGWSQQALELFEDMRLAGVRPNKITFVGVLSACSHAGMVDRAMSYFEMMKTEYKIKPVMDHFSCLIDMFVRLGRLEEAFDLTKKMDFKPNEFIWSMLIAGCRSHGNLELGFYAAEKLLDLNPKDAETYVLLLNMYLSAGRYQDVSRIRKIMKEEKLGKLKDQSWISIKDKVYSFKPNSWLHPQSKEMYNLLEDLLGKAKTLGYEPTVSSKVIDEEDEEKILSSTIYHSEKLAIAFGLLNTPNAAPIRVIKNIGMCRDSHNFIKFVSSRTYREIIIRDSRRLHKFVNGHCSCGDFDTLL